MKAIALYAAASVTLITASGALLALGFRSPAERQALLLSGAVALVVQLVAFAIARRMARTNVIAGWGIGALLSFSTLVIYGFVAQAYGWPLGAALLGLATFLFVTELVEPLLLRL